MKKKPAEKQISEIFKRNIEEKWVRLVRQSAAPSGFGHLPLCPIGHLPLAPLRVLCPPRGRLRFGSFLKECIHVWKYIVYQSLSFCGGIFGICSVDGLLWFSIPTGLDRGSLAAVPFEQWLIVKYPFYIPKINRQNQAFWSAYWRGGKPCNASCGRIVLYSSSQRSVISRTSSKLSNK